MWLKLGVIFGLLTLALASKNSPVAKAPARDSIRDKRLFSLFSIVTFKNEGCSTTDGSSTRNGTCFTSTECSEKGGQESGNCAMGFGVCCLFLVTSTSTTINQNCTYIRNPSYPSVYSATTALTYTINKCSSDVCAVRLDFESFTIEGPSATTETNGGACTDSFVVSGTSGLSSPTICGKNTGQHIYMEMGAGSTDTATLAFTFATTTSTSRTWEVKATQIPCGSISKPPDGCLQYHIGQTGRFQTFNFLESSSPQHLASQSYSICVRQEADACCVAYELCGDSNSFTIDAAIASKSEIDTQCDVDYVGIDGVGLTCSTASYATLHSRICGTVWNAEMDLANAITNLCDCTAPFVVEIYTDATNDGSGTATQRGLCLEYRQVPCTSL